MVTDQEIARGVETLLRQSDPNAFTSLNGVVQQLEATLGSDLSHKAGFIRDHISFLLRSHPVQRDNYVPQPRPQFPTTPQPQQFLHPHFAILQQQQQRQHPQQLPPQPPPSTFQQQQQNPPPPSPPPPPPPAQAQPQVQQRQPASGKVGAASPNAPEAPKGSSSAGTKRRGGPGGLNKVCGVSPELQAVVGEPALPRTEIVKQLWAYIRKHNLQDPGNKRKIICDDALRLVFETDCTDMFKMNKLLAKHIIPFDPTKESNQAKKMKIEQESAKESSEPGKSTVLLSDALAKFFGTGEKEMLQTEVLRRLWDYVKVNRLEDPLNSMVILCDAKLQELLGCESISALGMQEMIARHHLVKQ